MISPIPLHSTTALCNCPMQKRSGNFEYSAKSLRVLAEYVIFYILCFMKRKEKEKDTEQHLEQKHRKCNNIGLSPTNWQSRAKHIFLCFECKEIGGYYLPTDLLQMHILLYSKVGRGQDNVGFLWAVQCTTRLNDVKRFQKQNHLWL